MKKLCLGVVAIYLGTINFSFAANISFSVADACKGQPSLTQFGNSGDLAEIAINHAVTLHYFNHKNETIFSEYFVNSGGDYFKRHHINVSDFPVLENEALVGKVVCTGIAMVMRFTKTSSIETTIDSHFEIAELPSDVTNDKVRPQAPTPQAVKIDNVLRAKKGDRITIPVANSQNISHIDILYHGSF
jgi:hypothetical protein